jgi:hypothetical protein
LTLPARIWLLLSLPVVALAQMRPMALEETRYEVTAGAPVALATPSDTLDFLLKATNRSVSASGVTAAPPPAAYQPSAAPGPAGGVGPSTGVGSDVYVYPRNGQSEQQTNTDRYECHSWAANQTGFDPTRSAQTGTGTLPDYRRAMIACLDARGYRAR